MQQLSKENSTKFVSDLWSSLWNHPLYNEEYSICKKLRKCAHSNLHSWWWINAINGKLLDLQGKKHQTEMKQCTFQFQKFELNKSLSKWTQKSISMHAKLSNRMDSLEPVSGEWKDITNFFVPSTTHVRTQVFCESGSLWTPPTSDHV